MNAEGQLNLFTGKTAKQNLIEWANNLKPPQPKQRDLGMISIKKEFDKYPELFKK